jgi:hypothetical protein
LKSLRHQKAKLVSKALIKSADIHGLELIPVLKYAVPDVSNRPHARSRSRKKGRAWASIGFPRQHLKALRALVECSGQPFNAFLSKAFFEAKFKLSENLGLREYDALKLTREERLRIAGQYWAVDSYHDRSFPGKTNTN